MTDNAQKTPFQRSMNRFAEQKALSAIQITGKSLPASVVAVDGSIVTVKFEVQSKFTLPNVTCPLIGPEWIRYPTQIGAKGMVISADAYLGGMSGLGDGVASLGLQSNLSALVFCPFGNKNWSKTDDPNAVVIYGPNGAVIRTQDKITTVTISPGTVLSAAATTNTTGNLIAGTGCSGSFTTPTGNVVTVQDGIIVNIF